MLRENLPISFCSFPFRGSEFPTPGFFVVQSSPPPCLLCLWHALFLRCDKLSQRVVRKPQNPFANPLAENHAWQLTLIEHFDNGVRFDFELHRNLVRGEKCHGYL